MCGFSGVGTKAGENGVPGKLDLGLYRKGLLK